MADPSSSYCPRSCFDPDKPPDWFVNLFSTTFIYYTIFSLLPGMLTAAHTLLLAPLVPVYMALAYPISALLKTLGLLKHKDIPPLGPTGWKGKVVFVTGASAGIGLATARNLARYGATVVLGVRSPERGNAARERIVAALVAEGGHGTEAEIAGRVVVLKGDLQDLDDVARCARAFCDAPYGGRLDALILNAGLAGFHSRRTAQGYDLVLGVNFLGHYALARALLPLLESTARRFYKPEESVQPRVVCLSSTLHQWSRADPAFLLEATERRARGEAEKGHKAWYAYLLESVYKRDSYPDSKLAQLLLAQEINRQGKAGGARVRAVAVNPGAVVSDIWRFFPEEAREKYIMPVLRGLFLTPHQGSVPVVVAAVSESYNDQTDPDALYLTPYFVPFGGRFGGLVLFDLFSPAYGHQRALPRLPSNSVNKGQKLWRLGERISAPFLKAHGFAIEEARACCWLPLPVAGGKGQQQEEVVVKEKEEEEVEQQQQQGEEEDDDEVMAPSPERGGMGLVGKGELSPSPKVGGEPMEGRRVLSEPAQ